jgi:AcrR family transcriptional regulator
MSVQLSARERLIDAAEDLAATQGVASTPVDAILARAQVSPATLYAHFGNKEGLIAQALQRRLSRWDRTWQECVARARTPEDKALSVFDALAEHRSTLSPSRWCVFLGVAAETPLRGADLDETLMRDSDLLTQRLEELAEPIVGAGRSELAARQLVLIYTGVLGMILRGTNADEAITDGREVAAVALRSLGTGA